MESTEWLLTPLFAGRIGIWKCWSLRRKENRSTRRKTLGAGMRTNNTLNPHMTPSRGIEPGPHWWEASALTTAPYLFPAPCSENYLPRGVHSGNRYRRVQWTVGTGHLLSAFVILSGESCG